MLSFALRRFAGTLSALLLLAVAAAYGLPGGAAALARAAAGLPATLALVVGALLAGLVLGAPLGLIAGHRPNAALGHVAGWLAGVGVALPGFLAAGLAFMAFGRAPAVALVALALPALAEAVRIGRNGARAAGAQGFVLAARGRGVPARRAFLRHELPSALAPLAGALGGLAAATTAAAVAAEALFGIPGTGRALVEAARGGDAAGTVAALALLAGLVLLLKAVGTVLAGALDPRARMG